jgi:ssDNA-binding Zn-finger/Zn-ribbon topoisomerase 1
MSDEKTAEVKVKQFEICPKCGWDTHISIIRDGVKGKQCILCYHWWPETDAPKYRDHTDFINK